MQSDCGGYLVPHDGHLARWLDPLAQPDAVMIMLNNTRAHNRLATTILTLLIMHLFLHVFERRTNAAPLVTPTTLGTFRLATILS